MLTAIRRYRLPILSGFLIGTSYIPFYPWAEFFCLVPLFLFWWRQSLSKRQCFNAGWLTQFVLNLIGFHWIAYTATEFGHFHWIFGVLTLFGFAATAHLYYPLAGWLGRSLNERLGIQGKLSWLVFTLTFAVCDRLFPVIFPWHLGYTWLWAKWPGAQTADVIGFEGLHFFTILINALIAWSILEWTEGQKKPASGFSTAQKNAAALFAAAVAAVAAVNIWGLGREEAWKNTDAELNVLAIQGNIGNFEKYMVQYRHEFRGPIIQKYFALSRDAMAMHPEAHLMIWPETAFPGRLNQEYLGENLQMQLRAFLRLSKIPLLTGSYGQKWNTQEVFNGFFFLNAQGDAPVEPYYKTILLVFGETFPFSDVIPYMATLFPDQGSFTRGKGPTVMNLALDGNNQHDVKIGPQICYEGLYPWFSAGLSKQGAEIFANVTNDSWFWKPFEPNQHLYMTLARAIEFRRPLLRSTNTGITTAILASGEILEKSPIGEEWTGLFRIPYLKNPPHTVYEKYGQLWPWLQGLLLVAVLLIGRTRPLGWNDEQQQ